MRAYLDPVHTGFHLQLLYSLPGLRDASGAVVGHDFFHSAASETSEVEGWKRLTLLTVLPSPATYSFSV